MDVTRDADFDLDLTVGDEVAIEEADQQNHQEEEISEIDPCTRIEPKYLIEFPDLEDLSDIEDNLDDSGMGFEKLNFNDIINFVA